MRNIFFFCFLLTVGSIFGQSQVDFLNALGKNNVVAMESNLASRVSLSIEDRSSNQSRTEVVKKISEFMAARNVRSFKLLHTGRSSDQSSSYRVAKLRTDQGVYRIFAYSEKSKSNAKVIEIRIDKM